MRRLGTLSVIGALLAAPVLAQAGPQSDANATRVQNAARAALVPLPVESTRCFAATARKRRGITRAFCVVNVAAPAGEECSATVRVTARSRPRRVTARVTIPLRCHRRQPPPGAF
jgi:hypothetical protein